MSIDIFVEGIPQPKGSTRSFVTRGKVVTTNANKGTAPWEHTVRVEASRVIGAQPPGVDGVAVTLLFIMPRIKGHFTKRGDLREGAPFTHTKKPDLDKLERCVLDGLTGVAFVDDSQVISMSSMKIYADGESRPGVLIHLEDRT